MTITLKRMRVIIQHLYNAVCTSTFFRSLTPQLLWEPNEIAAFVSPGLHSLAEIRIKVENDGQLTIAMLQKMRRMTVTLNHPESFNAQDFDDFSAVVQDVLAIFKSTLPPSDEEKFVRGED